MPSVHLPLLLVALIASACAEGDVPRSLQVTPILGGATFDRPVEVGVLGTGELFIAEQGETVWRAVDAPGGVIEPLIDLTTLVDDELGEGLLSVALDPQFEENHHLWAYYFAHDDPARAILARFDLAEGDATLESELVVLEVGQPGYNQNGGSIRFGPDGMLYLSLGDGSASDDPFEQGQDPSTLLATVIRIDVSASTAESPYSVPPDNPLIGHETARPELYAWGFRNPFRMSIDAATGQVWLGDVGVSTAEEVNRVDPGGNHGWSVMEGDECLHGRPCDAEGFVPPVFTYSHEAGHCAVIGGVVYRGLAIPELHGHYVFGDFCSGAIWALDGEEAVQIAALEGQLVTFGEDERGEILLADFAGGGIYRLDTPE
ncbi:MAG: PQQ-dependent sugar dehydrogenase [Chloroflexi bacterium]|nr:PQQ-dependent sugar dehydrogenase [Chloroflexota bacterium]MDA1239398.1 PQQ-dependent sugar dehydrogenase [Chloroflexota bacterium]